MQVARKQRLYALAFIFCGFSISVALALVALQDNINLFYSPAQIVAGEAPVGKTIRGGGLVMPGSVERDSSSLRVRFKITDGEGDVLVNYSGLLPDLFQEGQGIVALGKLETNGEFCAAELLAKHSPDYMPAEVKAAVDKVHARKI